MRRVLLSTDFAKVKNVALAEKYTFHNYGAGVATRGSSLYDSNLSNLSGDGEIVAVSDSGLDYDMCFFRDDNEVVAFTRYY